MKKVVIIDEYFTGAGGHYYEYNKSVQDLLQENHIDTVIYANKKLDPQIARELKAIPLFSGLPKNFLNKIPLLGQLWNRFLFSRSLYKKLMALYRSPEHSESTFFFTTVVWYNVLPVALAVAKSRQQNLLLFRYSISELVGMPASMNKWGIRLYDYALGKLSKNKKTAFFTDSEVIADECNERYNCNMRVLPIPHVRDEYPAVVSRREEPSDHFRMYAPGPAREEKGIGFILAMLERMAVTKHPLLSRITFVAQYNTGDPALNAAIQERLQQNGVNHILLGNLSTEAYQEQLNSADIILIPYSPDHGYRARTSGILSETIAVCKPFITSKDSWMNIQAAKYDIGLSIAYNSIDNFIDALSELTSHYTSHKEKAVKAKAAWLAFHSKSNFFKILSEGAAAKSS